MTFREHKKILVSIYMYKFQFVTILNRTSKSFENLSRNMFFMAKIILNSVFERAREII